jgi:hypothetical protein
LESKRVKAMMSNWPRKINVLADYTGFFAGGRIDV